MQNYDQNVLLDQVNIDQNRNCYTENISDNGKKIKIRNIQVTRDYELFKPYHLQRNLQPKSLN